MPNIYRDLQIGGKIVIFAVIFSFYVIRSPIGRAFQALRDNPECAVARGMSWFIRNPKKQGVVYNW